MSNSKCAQHRLQPSQASGVLTREVNENVPICWLVGLFISVSSPFHCPTLLSSDTAMNRSHWLALKRQTARSQSRKDRAQVTSCVWDPKMVSSPEGIPKGSKPAPKHQHVAGPERTFVGVGGCPAQTLLICTKSPFRVIVWQGSLWAFFSTMH